MLRDETIFSARSDSHLQGAAGAEGGGEGGRGRLLRNAGSSAEEVLGSKVRHLILARGETIRIETPGGAGFGDPAARPLEALAEDLRDGLVTEAYARRFYGDALTDGALQAGGRAG